MRRYILGSIKKIIFATVIFLSPVLVSMPQTQKQMENLLYIQDIRKEIRAIIRGAVRRPIHIFNSGMQ